MVNEGFNMVESKTPPGLNVYFFTSKLLDKFLLLLRTLFNAFWLGFLDTNYIFQNPQNGKILSQGGYKKMETCYFCRKGILEDKKVTVDFRWGNKLVVIEEVPAKVCNECGEKYYSAEVSREMERIAIEGKKEKIIEVPLVRLPVMPSSVV